VSELGYVKLHRKMIDSLVMSDDFLCRLWVYLLLRANAKKTTYFKQTRIGVGEIAFHAEALAEKLGVSRSKLLRSLAKLKTEQQIKQIPNTKFTHLSICNWRTYQQQDTPPRTSNDTTSEHQVTQQPDINRTTIGHQPDTEQESKESKEGREREKEPKGSSCGSVDKSAQQFLDSWKSSRGVRECRQWNANRRKHFKARLADEIDGRPWLEVAKEILRDKFPLQCTRGSPGGWVPDVDWFLRPASLLLIIEGKYDFTRTENRSVATDNATAAQRTGSRGL